MVEAAGNGNENFDLPIFNGTGLQKDSGAIVVGAGIPPTNHFDNFGPDWGFPRYSTIGNPRSRIWFSNYGKIVNVQARGWHVTTTGYGDAQGHASENRWYTVRFSGTSSASPIVTGAVARIQGHAKAKHGQPLSPQQVRSMLMDTGTAQESGPGVPLSQPYRPPAQPHQGACRGLIRLLMAVVMLATPVMSPGGVSAPKALRPSLDVKLAAEWRYVEGRGVFVSSAGEEFAPGADLPKGTQIRYMVPHLAKADRATLSADERNLARYLQIVFPKGAEVDPYVASIAQWPCVEQVQRPPEISLP